MASKGSYVVHDLPTPVVVTETGSFAYVFETAILNETTTTSAPFAPRPRHLTPHQEAGWIGKPTAVALALLASVTAAAPFVPRPWQFSSPEAAVWSATARPNQTILAAPAAAPFIPAQRGLGIPDDPLWNGTQSGSRTIAMLAASRPFPPPAWRAHDEAPPNAIPAGSSGTIRILAAFQPAQPRFRPGEHDSDVRPWQWEPSRNITLYTPNVAVPFKPPAWRYAGDLTDQWRGAPSQAWALITPAAPPPPPRLQVYRPPLDHSDPWQWRAGNVPLAVIAVPAAPPPRAQIYRPSIDQSDPWQSRNGSPITVLAAPQAPFTPTIWRHPVEEPLGWRPAAPNPLALCQTLPFRNASGRAAPGEDRPLWQWRPAASLAATAPNAKPFVPLSWRFDVHEPGIAWILRPNILALHPPPIPPMPFPARRWEFDDVRIEVTWWSPPNVAIYHASPGVAYAITTVRAYSAPTNLSSKFSRTIVRVSRRS